MGSREKIPIPKIQNPKKTEKQPAQGPLQGYHFMVV
jgi:hypothetical protein